MKNAEQARGYLLEYIVMKLLNDADYVIVKKKKIPGRGAFHQIDAHGILSIPTAFIYPIRLIAESKYKKKTIGLSTVRDFVGVIKDISENYFVTSDNQPNTPERYTDVGCIFSANSFSIDAQKYAWAHNISLVSFYNNPKMSLILSIIDNFVRKIPLETLTGLSQDQLIEKFQMFETSDTIPEENKTSLGIGILDSTYPVVIAGDNNWIKDLPVVDFTDDLTGIKIGRSERKNEFIFNLDIKGKIVYFNFPKFMAKQFIDRIDSSFPGQRVFQLDIPIIKKTNIGSTRRILKINIQLPLTIKLPDEEPRQAR
jgi:hypothetical protein